MGARDARKKGGGGMDAVVSYKCAARVGGRSLACTWVEMLIHTFHTFHTFHTLFSPPLCDQVAGHQQLERAGSSFHPCPPPCETRPALCYKCSSLPALSLLPPPLPTPSSSCGQQASHQQLQGTGGSFHPYPHLSQPALRPVKQAHPLPTLNFPPSPLPPLPPPTPPPAMCPTATPQAASESRRQLPPLPPPRPPRPAP